MFIFAEYYRKINLNDYSLIDYDYFKKKFDKINSKKNINWFEIYPFYSDVIIENLSDYYQSSTQLNGFNIDKSYITNNKKIKTKKKFSNQFISDAILLHPINPSSDLNIIIKNRNPFSQLKDKVKSSTHFSFQEEHSISMNRDGDICFLFSSSDFRIKSQKKIDMIVNHVSFS